MDPVGTAEGSGALLELLVRAEVALSSGDTEAAAEVMQEGAALCARWQAAGIAVPPGEVEALRDIVARCGDELARLTEELNADSAKGENFRRGMTSYQSTR
jgi:hypothetical protein